MKRLFLRISALVALVVLGCIAIAQAQRGVEPSKTVDPAPPASEATADQSTSLPGLLPATPSATPAARLDVYPPVPGLSTAAPSPTPNPLPATPAENPLRDGHSARLRDVAAEPMPMGNPASPPVAAAPLASPSGDPFRRPLEDSLRPSPMPGARASMQAPLRDNADSGPREVGRGLAMEPAQPLSKVTAASNTEIDNGNVSGGLRGTAAPKGDDGMPLLGRGASAVAGRNTYQETQLAQNDRGLPATDGNTSPLRRMSVAAALPSRERDEPAPLQFDPRNAPAKLSSPYTTAANDGGMPSLGNGPLVDRPSAAEGNGRPGTQQLEGPQTPQLVIQKSVTPQSIRVGKPATFHISVANHGQVAAQGVEIHDQIPKGAQLITTRPQASRGASGEMVWGLGTLKPGDEVAVEMQLMPVSEGEIGSVASVHFAAEASARAVVTRPGLNVKITMPNRVLIGDAVPVSVTVSNPGSGETTGVVLKERVPQGLQCAAGSDVVYEVGTLRPGEIRQIQLPLSAAKGGKLVNVLAAEGEDNLKAEDRAEIEIIAPELDVAVEGPKRRYLERQATYTMSVSNPGTAPAEGIELVAYLPPGLKFVSANNGGGLDPNTQTVHWRLTELSAKDTGKVELVTMPIEAGPQKLRLEGRAEHGLAAQREQPIVIEGLAAVMFEVANSSGPVEVGSETAYEIRVVNQGSKEATNVRIVALLPQGMRAVAAEGPTRYALEPNRVQFESLATLAPKADTTYRVRVQGLQPGDQRIRVQLQTDEMQEPVTKEESTRVFANE